MQNLYLCYYYIGGSMRNKLIMILLVITVIVGIVIKNNRTDNLITEDYEPKYVINDLYKSKEIYYRSILNDEEKKIYEDIITAIIDYDSEISVESTNNFNVDTSKLSKIIDAIMLDHPELFYFSTITYYGKSNGIRIVFNYAITNDKYNDNLDRINKIIDYIKLETKDMDTYSKVKYVYEYLGNKNNYGDIRSVEGQTALSAFLDDLSPVCAGYAKASEIIFNNIGITSLLVRGDLKTNLFVGDSHLWNIVKIDNGYYLYDVTQSSITKNISNSISYVGLLSMKKSDYSYLYKKVVPYIKYDKNYYDMNNLSYTYKKNNIERLNNILNNGDKYIEVKVNNADSLYMNFNSIKKDINVVNCWRFNDIILFEKGD